MRKTLVSLLVGAGLIGLSGVAAARTNVDVGISFGFPAPVYVAPPPPVVYYPRPVYVAPPPVYYAPAPVYYGPPVYYRRDHGRHRGWYNNHYR